jgi:hypothetical protein
VNSGSTRRDGKWGMDKIDKNGSDKKEMSPIEKIEKNRIRV